MANYEGRTASTGARVKPGKSQALQLYLDGFAVGMEGEMEIGVENGYLRICGYDDFCVAGYDPEGNIDWDHICTEAFLEGLKPFLMPQGTQKDKYLIVVQTCGGEKCRFPLGAVEWILRPNGKVETNVFKH